MNSSLPSFLPINCDLGSWIIKMENELETSPPVLQCPMCGKIFTKGTRYQASALDHALTGF
jgi:hypothetical protein